MTTKTEPPEYFLKMLYDRMLVKNVSKLIYVLKKGVNAIYFYIIDSEIFNIFHDVHVVIGHEG